MSCSAATRCVMSTTAPEASTANRGSGEIPDRGEHHDTPYPGAHRRNRAVQAYPASPIVERSITVIDHVGPLARDAARTDLTNFARAHVAATVDPDAKRLVSGHIPGPGTHAPRSAGPC